jgi:hypothetical protein
MPKPNAAKPKPGRTNLKPGTIFGSTIVDAKSIARTMPSGEQQRARMLAGIKRKIDAREREPTMKTSRKVRLPHQVPKSKMMAILTTLGFRQGGGSQKDVFFSPSHGTVTLPVGGQATEVFIQNSRLAGLVREYLKAGHKL